VKCHTYKVDILSLKDRDPTVYYLTPIKTGYVHIIRKWCCTESRNGL